MIYQTETCHPKVEQFFNVHIALPIIHVSIHRDCSFEELCMYAFKVDCRVALVLHDGTTLKHMSQYAYTQPASRTGKGFLIPPEISWRLLPSSDHSFTVFLECTGNVSRTLVYSSPPEVWRRA